ncbi:MAG: C40 family peptidase, partial [Spirochaetaceae bacterium]|nr:C40 family peptidase [Spirochaetaceae bacterium]
MKKKFLLCACLCWGFLAALWPLDPVRQKIIDAARQYVGVPYVYGAASPSGFDCSGFVGYVYNAAAGISLPRTSKNIWASGETVRTAAAQPGDLIVFDTVGGAPSHVAILLDDETMIHAVSQGPRTGVIISPVQDRYFAPRIMGMRSFIG